MARYRGINLSPRLLPLDLEAQLVPGTFAHAVHHLVDDPALWVAKWWTYLTW